MDDIKKARLQHISKYVTDLRHVTGYYSGWVSETIHDVEQYYEILQTDATIKHGMHLLSLMVAGDSWEIEGPNARFNFLVTKAFKNIERFTHARKSMVEKSVLFGLSVQQKEWKKEIWPEYGRMVWNIPKRLKEVDRRRMRLERDLAGIGDKNNVYWTIWSPEVDQYVVLEDKNKNPRAKYSLQNYLWMWYEFEELSPMYRGFGECLYILAYIKKNTIQYWGNLAEHFGTPFIIASINAAKAAYNMATNAGTGAQDAQTIIDNWLDILENMRSRHVAVKPEHDSIDIHEAGSVGQNILKELIEYVDQKIELLLLGSELVTQAPSVGSYALGQIHEGATASIVLYNRQNIEEILSRDLIRDFYLKNRMNFYSLGIKHFPCDTTLKIKSTKEERKWNIEAAEAQGSR